MSQYSHHTHHIVVLVGQDVAVPNIFARFVEGRFLMSLGPISLVFQQDVQLILLVLGEVDGLHTAQPGFATTEFLASSNLGDVVDVPAGDSSDVKLENDYQYGNLCARPEKFG